METKKKRLTLDLEPNFQRRLKAIAALKGVSMRRYRQDAIDRELTKDEANGMGGLLSDKPDHELFAELRQEIFGGKPLPGSSADLIREAREIRDAEIEAWAVPSSSMQAWRSSGWLKRMILTKPTPSFNPGLTRT